MSKAIKLPDKVYEEIRDTAKLAGMSMSKVVTSTWRKFRPIGVTSLGEIRYPQKDGNPSPKGNGSSLVDDAPIVRSDDEGWEVNWSLLVILVIGGIALYLISKKVANE